MVKYKLEIADGCISCGLCVATCPDLFEMREHAVVKKAKINDISCAKKAAQNCPVSVIHLKDIKSKKRIM